MTLLIIYKAEELKLSRKHLNTFKSYLYHLILSLCLLTSLWNCRISSSRLSCTKLLTESETICFYLRILFTFIKTLTDFEVMLYSANIEFLWWLFFSVICPSTQPEKRKIDLTVKLMWTILENLYRNLADPWWPFSHIMVLFTQSNSMT